MLCIFARSGKVVHLLNCTTICHLCSKMGAINFMGHVKIYIYIYMLYIYILVFSHR